MTAQLVASGALVALWLLLALLMPVLGQRHRAAAYWLLVVTGVPVLGWLTWKWGPGIGVAAFVLGMFTMHRRPTRPDMPPAETVTAPAE